MLRIRTIAGILTAALMLCIPLISLAAEGTVNTSSLILRKSPTKSSRALQTLDRGDSLEIISQSGDWYKVTYGRYTGYVMKKYVKVSGKVTAESTESKEETKADQTVSSTAPAASRPGSRGAHVKTLQTALKKLGYYKGKIDGVYGSGTKSAVIAFQRKNGLARDGIAGPKTIGALFGKSSSSSAPAETKTRTEALNWFSGGSSVIPRGAVFTVKDVKTGKTFQVKRWAGVNHADCEPLTSADTAVMKSIYGGKWSWNRRAILIQYNGHVYAASMNGMPHGDDPISGNGFGGHFCIHFTGSRTHGTNRVDSDHQSCVSQALKATW